MTAQPAARPIDTASAQELLKEATRGLSTDDLDDLGRRLERKAARFGRALARERLATLDERAFGEVLDLVFSVRTRRKALFATRSMPALRQDLEALLHGPEPVAERFAAFTAALAPIGARRARTLGSELLHFTNPSRYWLWTPWIWDPETGQGALRLVTSDTLELDGADDAERYNRIGRATALLTADGAATGYTRLAPGLLGTDVFLATAYGVYMVTLYQVRISQEFKRFLPELSELARRLLGVQHLPEA